MDQFPQKLWFRIMKDMKALGLGCGVRLWCCVVPLEFSVPSFHSPCTMPAPGSLCGTTAMFRMSFLRNQAIFVTTVFSQTDQTAFLLCLLDPRILGALMKIEELRSCG